MCLSQYMEKKSTEKEVKIEQKAMNEHVRKAYL